MIGKGSVGKSLDDKVFAITDRAKKAIEIYGKENVINATIGVLYDDNEKLVSLDTVVDTYRNLEVTDIFSYASEIDGDSLYKEAVRQIVLGKNYKDDFIGHFTEVIATPGGTGAIRNSLKNYLNPGEKVLLPKLMWGPYKIMAEEGGAPFDTYEMFDETGKFNIKDFKNKVVKLLKEQENVVIIINDPCHNPTGYTLEINEWKEILKFLEECSEEKNIILLNDIAYMDFSKRNLNEYRNLFKNLLENLLVIFLFSMSKSYTCYGLRAGAQLALSKNKNVIDEFLDVNKFSCRATWSNISRGAMALLSQIVLDDKKLENLSLERNRYRHMLYKRAEIFLKESREIELEVFPYRDGFFITIPIKQDIEAVVKKLESENIFVVPLKNEIRIGLCSISIDKIYGLSKKIKQSIKE
ncbi:pyridoxal phosphate-dependent aminotransferase [uncultured Fusobacterium sp.]|uniref:pyridoxal phosphate-dependent aminotransferase n=1 Tax=uncultured Fusobacterium sp. TaxID=159267 RepID=UPI00258DF02D|nr:aminotransferase class I/II-fold pyridoxal phosphate-dependent enzyme [uncultured Fusobacterium sp.]